MAELAIGTGAALDLGTKSAFPFAPAPVEVELPNVTLPPAPASGFDFDFSSGSAPIAYSTAGSGVPCRKNLLRRPSGA